MKTIKELIDSQRLFDENKDDQIVPISQVEFTPDGLISFTGYDKQHYQPYTDHALAQICSKLGVPVLYMKTLPTPLLAENMNYWLSQVQGDSSWMIRSYKNTIRAVLSPAYPSVYSSTMLQAVAEILDGVKYTLIRPFSGVDSVHLKMMMKTPSGYKEYGTGAYFGNDEVGMHAIRAWPLVQRYSCENSITSPAGGTTVRHVHMSRDIIIQRVKSWVLDALNTASKLVHRTDVAKAVKVSNINDLIDNICIAHDFTDEVREKIKEGTEGENTINGLINGLSFAAQHAETQEISIKLESLAGSYLSSPDMRTIVFDDD